VAPKRYESRHHKETPLGKKVVNLKNKSTKGDPQKPKNIDCLVDFIARPLFPLGRTFPAVILISWKLTKHPHV